MSAQVQDPHPPQNAEEVDDNVLEAVKSEMQHELAHMIDNKVPVDSTQSDVLVQKHVDGLFIVILSVVVAFLLVAIAGIYLYSHR